MLHVMLSVNGLSLALSVCMLAYAFSLAARSLLVQLPPAGLPQARRGLLGGALFFTPLIADSVLVGLALAYALFGLFRQRRP